MSKILMLIIPENEFLTDREQVEAMDDALIESLDRFEECIKAKATARKYS